MIENLDESETDSYFEFIIKVFSYVTDNIQSEHPIGLFICEEIIENDIAHGRHFFDTEKEEHVVLIFLKKLLTDAHSANITDTARICGILIPIITHEVMHCLQLINVDLYNCDDGYRMFIETDANLKTIRFIKERYTTLVKLFGEFSNTEIDSIEIAVNEYINIRGLNSSLSIVERV